MTNKIKSSDLIKMKVRGEKIACLTVYDAGFAKILDSADVDVLLVGDSLGMVLHGESNTLQVTVDDMVYHTKIAKKGIDRALLVADMPSNSYSNVTQALKNAERLIEVGAEIVKLEGGSEILEIITSLHSHSILVCGHLGLQPQSIELYGGYKVQGKNKEDAERILNDAKALEQAGVLMIVLECIPQQLAEKISSAISIPTIGIGAGIHCDGQVLVLYDLIGVSSYIPRMACDFLRNNGTIINAVNEYVRVVKAEEFPTAEQSFN